MRENSNEGKGEPWLEASSASVKWHSWVVPWKCLHLEGGDRIVKKSGSVGWISRKLGDSQQWNMRHFVEPQEMVNSQHSTKGKVDKWRERGFHGMTEHCLYLQLVGIGTQAVSSFSPYLCASDLTLLHRPFELRSIGFLLCSSLFLVFSWYFNFSWTQLPI